MGSETALIIELMHPKKVTHHYLLAVEGQCSQGVMSEEEKKAILNMKANNDTCKGNFATFTDILCRGGYVDIGSAAGIGQTRYNKDMARDVSGLVKGGKSKKEDSKPQQEGIFHKLPEKLQNSLLALCKKDAGYLRQSFAKILQRQRATCAEKKKAVHDPKLQDRE